MRRRGASGITTASRVKSLLLHVQSRYGRAEADAFLLQTRLDRDYLDDETRPLPMEIWHAALVAFASRWGREEIEKTSESVVHPENLGVWTRVLRGANEPAQAFAQLDRYGGDEALTDRWFSLQSEPGSFHGRIPLRNANNLEGDGLCALARATELSAVPLLFGLEPGRVETLPPVSEPSGTLLQEVRVRWSGPPRAPVLTGAGVGLLSAAIAAFALSLPLLAALLTAGNAVLLGAGAALLYGYDVKRRAQSRAQLVRIQTLERSAALRDRREGGVAGFGEGTVVAGQYRLAQKLGVGASGTIWEAERLSDGTLVAIKLLRAAVAHDTVAADRLRREAEALGLAWHPNVVEVYDEGHLPDGTSYLVMERLFGESLAMRLKHGGPLSPELLLPIALQVCDALGAVHAAGVVHRDLKPSNIFLAQGQPVLDPAVRSISILPSGERVKLLDFGVARVEWAETRLTNMDVPLGTPGYMSPEQEQGLEIDARSDLFALGGVLYECLTGMPPPVRSEEIWARPRDESSDAPSGVQRAFQAIPSGFRQVIEIAMAPLPRDRYADARMMREAIRALSPEPEIKIKNGS